MPGLLQSLQIVKHNTQFLKVCSALVGAYSVNKSDSAKGISLFAKDSMQFDHSYLLTTHPRFSEPPAALPIFHIGGRKKEAFKPRMKTGRDRPLRTHGRRRRPSLFSPSFHVADTCITAAAENHSATWMEGHNSTAFLNFLTNVNR